MSNSCRSFLMSSALINTHLYIYYFGSFICQVIIQNQIFSECNRITIIHWHFPHVTSFITQSSHFFTNVSWMLTLYLWPFLPCLLLCMFLSQYVICWTSSFLMLIHESYGCSCTTDKMQELFICLQTRHFKIFMLRSA